MVLQTFSGFLLCQICKFDNKDFGIFNANKEYRIINPNNLLPPNWKFGVTECVQLMMNNLLKVAVFYVRFVYFLHSVVLEKN